MTVGNLDSDERGSGARMSKGKAPFDLLPLGVAMDALKPCREDPSGGILRHLAAWQAGADVELDLAFHAATSASATLLSLANAARVFDYGRRKYKDWNWAKGMPWSVPLGCAIRHCLAIYSGEDTDPESGLPHMAHVQCNLLMLLTFRDTYPEGDDRPVKWLKDTL